MQKTENLTSLLMNNKKLFLFFGYEQFIDDENCLGEFVSYKKIPDILIDNLNRIKIYKLTSVQKLTLTYFFNQNGTFDTFQGKDIIVCSQTGSGKTLAYLIPIISDLLLHPEKVYKITSSKNYKSYPLILVILPTRELVVQTYKEFVKILKGTYINTVSIYGGEKQYEQINLLKNGCDVLVATTGRLLDFLSKGIVSLSEIQYLIIDEADELLDMGFDEDIYHIMNDFDLRKNNYRSLLFSATFNRRVKKMINAVIKPGYVFINSTPYLFDEEDANGNVTQKFYLIEGRACNIFKLKLINLMNVLQLINGKTLIFANTKLSVETIANALESNNYGLVSIHGDYDMQQRKHSMEAFINGECNLMIATDVLSRGIDIPNVEYVINFDMPNDFRQYIHRIGRTGRVGNFGCSITFLTVEDRNNFKNIEKVLVENKQEIPDFIYKY